MNLVNFAAFGLRTNFSATGLRVPRYVPAARTNSQAFVHTAPPVHRRAVPPDLQNRIEQGFRNRQVSQLVTIGRGFEPKMRQELLERAEKKHNCHLDGAEYLAAATDNKACKRLIQHMPEVHADEKKETEALAAKFNRLTLNAFTSSAVVNLNELAAQKKLERAYGREKEVEQIITLLSSGKRENIMLLAEPGIGKTALVHELARRLQEGSVPKALQGYKVWELSLETLIGKSNTYFGLLQDNLQSIIKFVKSTPKVIVFIDEFHKVESAGATLQDTTQSIGEQLKTVLMTGDFTVIGASTPKEYDFHISQRNPALARRFYPIKLQEPDEETTESILKSSYRGLIGNLASDVVVTPGAIETITRLARSDMSNVMSPAKERRILDSLIKEARMLSTSSQSDNKARILREKLQLLCATNYSDSLLEKGDTSKLQRDVRRLMQEIQQYEATKAVDETRLKPWEKARDELDQLQKNLQQSFTTAKQGLKNSANEANLTSYALDAYCLGLKVKEKEQEVKKHLEALQIKSGPMITSEMAAVKVAELSGIPVRGKAHEMEWLQTVSKELKASVVGQDHATDTLMDAYVRFRTGMKDPQQTIGNYLFIGPTGLGKTYLAHQFANKLMGKERFHQFNMGEYTTSESFQKLLGDARGLDNGLLASVLRKHPHSVILFDEFEKAPDIYRILLEVLDRGTITNNDGTQLQGGDSLFVMTTNLASGVIQRYCQAHPGPLSAEQLEELNKLLLDELMKSFPPEFLNRLDGIIPFLPLSKEACFTITEGLLKNFAEQAYREKKLEVIMTPQLTEYCAERGFDPKFGARPLKRLIKSLVRTLIAKALQQGTIKEGDSVTITIKEGKPALLKKSIKMVV